MQPLKLHIKTALLASAVALAVLIIALLLISVRVANQFRDEQKQLAKLEADNLAEHLSLFPDQEDQENLERLTDLISGSRPNLVTVRIWKFNGADFEVQASSDDNLPLEEIPQETKDALRKGAASQTVNQPQQNLSEPLFRVFSPIVVKNHVDGAVEVVEKLDTVSTVALHFVLSLAGIAVATILLMTAAFYLLFQNVVYLPLEKLLTAMNKAKAGNLTAEIAGKEKPDEFGLLANGFNSMMTQIREMTAERERRNEILNEKVQEATFELSAKNDQLETANLELFRAVRRMSEMERLAAAGQTAAEFAHEVGTPLNLISGHVQLLQTKFSADSKESNRLQTISEQIERIETIVRDMLDRARFGSGEQTALNLNSVLSKIFDAIEPTLQESNVELTTNLDAELPNILGDSERLEQVFFNLVKNALDAMPEGGKLIVSTAFEQSKVIVEFVDNGVGMNEEILKQIFQPLFTTKERGRGTGLGLVVVKQILQYHDAEIEVKSKPGEGTNVKLFFNKFNKEI